LTIGGAVPAYFGSKHGQSPEGNFGFILQKKTPLWTGGVPAGFQRLAGLGVGASAKLADQPKTDQNVPKISSPNFKNPNLCGNYHFSTAELPRVGNIEVTLISGFRDGPRNP
jgi:hypothetical protein